ncbi:family 78 glycoside hydrolase catalytic domain [Sphingobacterium sp. SGG-5]|uniref:family 78 glycoside hydrolase catalytic domain n=1 Tax=Sphingobacterium sp. SGG-5 TaxID=2710881 RepID=UPI0013EBD743|nr:family 78 glycoside hydrolase catalytic domain [Sphingobacterium sp. SGG-5]NGM60923.1 family 78 glycoside hydrolase catalytic domain [Sphingobacterium sp. SGG-5]
MLFKIRQILAAILLSAMSIPVLHGQDVNINPALLQGRWDAQWITCPNVPQKEYGVYHFRKTFTLSKVKDRFIVHVTADNRYRLFVNGHPVTSGPARGDLYHWYFESVDIAPYLHPGENVIAALVWNMGEHMPVAQISNQTAFLIQGDTEGENVVNTDSTWRVLENQAYSPCSTDNERRMRNYMVVGPGDRVEGADYPWNWELPGYDDSNWLVSHLIVHPVPTGYGTDNRWTLVPRNIPLFEEKQQRIPKVRRANIEAVQDGFLTGQKALRIPANSQVSLLLDQTYNTVAYPELLVSKGKGAEIKLTYAEALYDKHFVKGNRNDIEGKNIIGNDDIFIADGGVDRKFRPLWFRTYRYVQLDIVTKDEDLLIDDFYGMATGYPFRMEASFRSNDPSLQEIWDVAWRTQLICAGETFFDTPYYEQLQYPGDTRLQALVTLYMSGDDRLMRKAILDFYHSKIPEGLPQGRYPSNRLQVIPTFSLFWVSMVYDYWMHRQDDAFIEQFLSSVRDVLDWHERYIQENTKILGKMPWWNFIDWVPGLVNSRGGAEGNTAIRTLHYSYTLQQAAALFAYFHKQAEADHYHQVALSLNAATYETCFNKEKGLMADAPNQSTYSQHANIMAIISHALSGEEAKQVMDKVLTDRTLSQSSFYYRFYLTRALHKTGMADSYYAQLEPWREMLRLGLTTFAETPEPTRSDSHAWASVPNYEFLATICGIRPAEPGFKSVIIQPAFGELEEIEGEMPHPLGKIKVALKKQHGNRIVGKIILPPNLTGTFMWRGKEMALHAGIQEIDI